LFEQHEFLTKRYLELAGENASIVVVSQTWSEIHKVNESIRDGLRKRNALGSEDVSVLAFERLDLTDAQKRDKRFYSDDSIIILSRGVAGLKRGTKCRLLEINNRDLIVEGSGKIRRIPFTHLDRVTVCEPKELALTSGDRLQLKANGKTSQGKQIANWGNRYGQKRSAGWTDTIAGWENVGRELWSVRSRLCGHILRRSRQNCRLRHFLGFSHKGGDQSKAVVRHNLAWSERD
jgi:hypothetical protein